jgi:hypothetical protein
MQRGCEWFANIKQNFNNSFFISKCNPEHYNHDPDPGLLSKIKSKRVLQKNYGLIKNLAKTSMTPAACLKLVNTYASSEGHHVDYEDIKNTLKKERSLVAAQSEGFTDIGVAVDFLKQKAENFGWRYALQHDGNTLKSLVWCSSSMISAVNEFPDVAIIDSTYKKCNSNMPLVIMVVPDTNGVTRIAACGLFAREQRSEYEFLFSFLKDEVGWVPKVLFSDAEPGLLSYIEGQTDIRGFLCLWHLLENFRRNLVGNLRANFHETLNRLILIRNITCIDTFQKEFNEFIMALEQLTEDVEGSSVNGRAAASYLKLVLKERANYGWAKAHMSGYFTFDINSTSRVESINRVVGRALSSRSTAQQVIEEMDKIATKPICRKEHDLFKENNLQYKETLVAELMQSFNAELVRSLNHNLSKYLMAICIKQMNDCFKFDIKSDNLRYDYDYMFNVSHVQDASKSAKVGITSAGLFICSCNFLVNMGLLCSHIWCLHVKELIIMSPFALIKPSLLAKKLEESLLSQSYHPKARHDRPISEIVFTYDDGNVWHLIPTNTIHTATTISHSSYHTPAVNSKRIQYLELHAEAKTLVNEAMLDPNKRTLLKQAAANVQTEEEILRTLKSPTEVRTKGRPPTKRMKSALERPTKKSTKKPRERTTKQLTFTANASVAQQKRKIANHQDTTRVSSSGVHKRTRRAAKNKENNANNTNTPKLEKYLEPSSTSTIISSEN